MRRLIVSIVVFSVVASVTTAAADSHDELTDADVAQVGTSIEELSQLEPNRSWDGLGFFSDDALRVLEFASEPVDLVPYAFGDDLDTPPVITAPGTQVTDFGIVHTRVPETWTAPPVGVNGDFAFAQTGVLSPGDDLMLVWSQFDSDFDFSAGLSLNEGVTLAIPGLPVWNSAFEGDTWEGANVIPTAQLDNGVLTFEINSFEPPQSFPVIDLPAFYYRSGNVMAVGISSAGITELVAQGENQNTSAETEGHTETLLYTGSSFFQTTQEGTTPDWADKVGGFGVGVGLHQHTSRGLFTPGFVVRMLATATTLLPFVLTALVVFKVLLAPPSTTASAEPDPEPTDTGTNEPAAPADADQPAASSIPPATTPDAGGSSFPLVVLLVAILLILAGIVLVFGPRIAGGRTRARGGDETGG